VPVREQPGCVVAISESAHPIRLSWSNLCLVIDVPFLPPPAAPTRCPSSHSPIPRGRSPAEAADRCLLQTWC
jgi:hypothetical protein